MVWIAERSPQTARGGSRGLSARWCLPAVDRVFLIAPIVPGLNLTPAKENQYEGRRLRIRARRSERPNAGPHAPQGVGWAARLDRLHCERSAC